MARKIPAVADYMSRLPVEIDRRRSVKEAHTLMRRNRVRHLPVMDGTKLFGVISERDTSLAIALNDEHADKSVGDLCSREPLTASPTSSVTQIAQELIVRRVGSAVVVDGGVVVGMFTSIDAMQALCDDYGA